MSELLLYAGLVFLGALGVLAFQMVVKAIREDRAWDETVAGLRRMERQERISDGEALD